MRSSDGQTGLFPQGRAWVCLGLSHASPSQPWTEDDIARLVAGTLLPAHCWPAADATAGEWGGWPGPPQASAGEDLQEPWLLGKAGTPPLSQRTAQGGCGQETHRKQGHLRGPREGGPSERDRQRNLGTGPRHTGFPGSNGMWCLLFPGRRGQVRPVISAFTPPPSHAACAPAVSRTGCLPGRWPLPELRQL